MHYLPGYYEPGKYIACIGDPAGESVKLFVERSLDRTVDLGFLKHFPHLGCVTYLKGSHHAVPFHHLCAAHYMVRRICGVRVEVGGVSGFGTQWLAGECRFVHTECHGVKKYSVSRDFVTGVQKYYVAHHHIFSRDCCRCAVAHHLDEFIVVDLIQYGEGFVGFLFEDECEAGGEKYGDEYAYRLEEHFPVLPQTEVFIE